METPFVVAPLDEVINAIDGMDMGRPWEQIAPRVVPILPRRRPFPGEAEPPVLKTWPPGIQSAFGIDLGPAFLYIGAWALEKWGITLDELGERAVANIREKAARNGEAGLTRDMVGDEPMHAFHSRHGWASALLLAPDTLVKMFGNTPSLILTPMRDLVVQLPIGSDLGFAAWLLEDFAALDPGGLRVPLMALIDGELVLVNRDTRDRVLAAGRRH